MCLVTISVKKCCNIIFKFGNYRLTFLIIFILIKFINTYNNNSSRLVYIYPKRFPSFSQVIKVFISVIYEPFFKKSIFYTLIHELMITDTAFHKQNFGHLFYQTSGCYYLIVTSGNSDNTNDFTIKFKRKVNSLFHSPFLIIFLKIIFIKTFRNDFVCSIVKIAYS